MKEQQLRQMKWLLLGIALLVALWASSTQSQPQSYMVRAVVLDETGGQYTVGVLYQAPDAAANSADVQITYQLAQGQGDSLAEAVQAVEQAVGGQLSYQLSDYLLLASGCTPNTVQAYAALVQTAQCGRYSAKVSALSQDMAQLEALIAQTPQTASILLERLVEDGQNAPALYDVLEDALPMPLLNVQDDGTLAAELLSCSLGAQGRVLYDAVQTQLYALLHTGQGTASFMAGELSFSVGMRVHSRSDVLCGVTDEMESVQMFEDILSAQGDAISAYYTHIQTEGFVESVLAFQSNQTSQNSQSVTQQLPCLRVYAVVTSASDTSPEALATMQNYLNSLADENGELLALLHVSGVEVQLVCPAQLC